MLWLRALQKAVSMVEQWASTQVETKVEMTAVERVETRAVE